MQSVLDPDESAWQLAASTRCNCLFLSSKERMREQRLRFERDILFSPSAPRRILILVDRPSQINAYRQLLLSEPDDASPRACLALDGLLNLDAVERDWHPCRRISGEAPLATITSANTALGVLTHGFCRLSDFDAIYVPEMPAGENGHPVNKILRLHYDPVVLGLLCRVYGWDVVADVSAPGNDGQRVLAMTRWTERLRHCRRTLHCQPVPMVATLPVDDPASYCSASSLLSYHVSATKPDDQNGLWIDQDAPEERICQLVVQIGDRLRRGQRLRVHSVSAAQLAQVKAWLDIIAPHLPCPGPPVAPSSPAYPDGTGSFRLSTGALVHAETAVDTLLRYCSYLPKVSSSGRQLAPPALQTVPVREFDASGAIVRHSLPAAELSGTPSAGGHVAAFATKCTLPERLSAYFGKGAAVVVGSAQPSRLLAQQQGALRALHALWDHGLLTEHLMPIPELRAHSDEITAEEGDSVVEEDIVKVPTSSKDVTNETLGEELPEVMLVGDSVNVKSFRLYAMAYRIEPSVPGAKLALPLSSEVVLGGPFGQDSFLDTQRSSRCFGVLLPHELPCREQWPTIRLPLGHVATACIDLEPVVGEDGSAVTIAEPEWRRILDSQMRLFGLLNVRPLSTVSEEELREEEGWELLARHTAAYWLVPLRKAHADPLYMDASRFAADAMEAFLRFILQTPPKAPTEPGGDKRWQIDWQLVDCLGRESSVSMDFDAIHGAIRAQAPRLLSTLGDAIPPACVAFVAGQMSKEELVVHTATMFAMSQCVLLTPYNDMHYRYRKLDVETTPDSAFEHKNVPAAKTYRQYVTIKYFGDDAGGHASPPAPSSLPSSSPSSLPSSSPFPSLATSSFGGMLAASRLENFADLAQWLMHTPRQAEEEDAVDDHVDGDAKVVAELMRTNLFAYVAMYCTRSSVHSRVKKRRRPKESAAFGGTGDDDNRSVLIPALVKASPLPYWLFRALLLVPRATFELERQLVAVQFYRRTLGVDMTQRAEHVALAVESLTATTAALPASYERLEVLGDCFLKVAVSMDLMALEPRWGEGRLSQRRQAKICNSTLYKLGLHEWAVPRALLLVPFPTKLWCPPGLLPLIPMPTDESTVRKDHLHGDPLPPASIGDLLRQASTSQRAELMLQKCRLRRLMFDGRRRWQLLQTFTGSHQPVATNDDELWTLRPGGVLLPPSSSTTSSGSPNTALSRYGQGFAAKVVADAVEAVIGAVYLAHGFDAALSFLVDWGVCTRQVLSASTLGTMRLAGSLAGDPRDKLPLKRLPHSMSVMKKRQLAPSTDAGPDKKMQRQSSEDWGRLKPALPPSSATVPAAKSVGDDNPYDLAEEELVQPTAGVEGGSLPVATIVEADGAAEWRHMLATMRESLEAVQRALGYAFREPLVLKRALTHASADAVHCMERVEWLGDALLDWLVTTFFYARAPAWLSPGELTTLRKTCVNNVALAEVAVHYGLHRHVVLGEGRAGAVQRDLERFSESVLAKHAEYRKAALGGDAAEWANALHDSSVAGREGDGKMADRWLSSVELHWELCQQDPLPPKLLGDVVEAAIGAMFVDMRLDVPRAMQQVLAWMQPFLQRHLAAFSPSPPPPPSSSSTSASMASAASSPPHSSALSPPTSSAFSTATVRSDPISACLEAWAKLGVPRQSIVFSQSLSVPQARAEDGDGEPGPPIHETVVKLLLPPSAGGGADEAIIGRGVASTRLLSKQLAAAKAVDFLRADAPSAHAILTRHFVRGASAAGAVDPMAYRAL